MTGTGEVSLNPTAYIYAASDTSYFTLDTFYLSCVGTGAGVSNLGPVPCSIMIEGTDINDMTISAQTFNYVPNLLGPKMSQKEVQTRFKASKLKSVKVTLVDGALAGASGVATVVEIDNLKHCNYA